MKRTELIENIRSKGSFLCVGLDPDIKKLPAHLLKEENPIFAFNKPLSMPLPPIPWHTSLIWLSTRARALKA